MRKLTALIICLAAIPMIAMAYSDKKIGFDQLPEQSRQFIDTHFAGQTIALVKMDTGIFDRSYEVLFSNGSKIEFDGKGLWKEVECKSSEVPDAIIPQRIQTFLKREYPAVSVVKIERERRGGYEVGLSNGFDLTFDSDFNLIDIDD